MTLRTLRDCSTQPPTQQTGAPASGQVLGTVSALPRATSRQVVYDAVSASSSLELYPAAAIAITSSASPPDTSASMVGRGRRFESVRGCHKRPANGRFCCLRRVTHDARPPLTCPQDLSPTLQEPFSVGLRRGF